MEVLQSTVLPFRIKKEVLEVLLVTSIRTGRWVLPKGHIPSGYGSRESAEKEAYEEAGIRGVTKEKSIGHYHYTKSEARGGALCRVDVFPMQVTETASQWPEKSQRQRKWMPIGEAAAAVIEPELQSILDGFEAWLKKNGRKWDVKKLEQV